MTLVRVQLCERCENQLVAWKQKLGERAMAAMAGQILQKCPECASKLPPTEGHLFTKLPSDFEPDFQPDPRPR